jgi:putative transposase
MMPTQKQDPHSRNLRLGRFSESGRVYFITKCVDRSVGINLSLEPLATCICNAILHRKRAGAWHLLSFVLMPDHLHLLVALGDGKSLSRTVGSFSQFTTSELNSLTNRHGIVWQKGYHDHCVRKAVEKCPELISYIHDNPVRKGLCAQPEEWTWSTASRMFAPEVESEWFW